MNWYKKAQEIYRGDPNPVSIQDYDPEYGTKTLGKGRGGPGIYFTTKEEDATAFGPHITKAMLHGAHIISKQDKKFNKAQINNILDHIDHERMALATSNWDENPRTGKTMLINSIMQADDPVDQIMLVWADVFCHQNASEFMRLMVDNNVDGVIFPKEGSNHYVIFNKSVLGNQSQRGPT